MARTKQTATKSTSGTGQRVGKLLWKPPPPATKSKSKASAAPSAKDVDPHTIKSFLVTTPATDATAIAHTCHNCHDGGKLFVCTACECAAVCDKCVIGDVAAIEASDYYCPNCCLSRGIPYAVTLRTAGVRRAHKIQNGSPVGVIALYLNSDTSDDSSFCDIICTFVHGHFAMGSKAPHPVSIFSRPFRLECSDEGIQVDAGAQDDLRAFIEGLVEINCQSLLVLLKTHSDNQDGGLFLSPTFQTGISTAFEALFGISSLYLLEHKIPNSLLVLATCGYTLSLPPSIAGFQAWNASAPFRQTIAFRALGFHPIYAAPWVCKLFSRVHFEGMSVRTAIPCTLMGEDDLGAHTDILLFDRGHSVPTIFRWAPNGTRPFGLPAPHCCGKIMVLSTNSCKANNIRFHCQQCNMSSMVHRPETTVVDAGRSAEWVRF